MKIMHLRVITCKGTEYAAVPVDAWLSNQILRVQEQTIEVELVESPMIYGHSKGINNVNMLLKDLDDSKEDYQRKYFIQTSFWTKQRIKWMFNTHPLQSDWMVTFVVTTLATIIGGFIVFLLTGGSPFNSNELEISEVQIKSDFFTDTLLVTLNNSSNNAVELTSIGIEFINVSKIERFSLLAFEIVQPTGEYVLPENHKFLRQAMLGREGRTNSIPISFKVAARDIDQIALIVSNANASHLADFRIVVSVDDDWVSKSETHHHVFGEHCTDLVTYLGVDDIDLLLQNHISSVNNRPNDLYLENFRSEKLKLIRMAKKAFSPYIDRENCSYVLQEYIIDMNDI